MLRCDIIEQYEGFDIEGAVEIFLAQHSITKEDIINIQYSNYRQPNKYGVVRTVYSVMIIWEE